MFRYIFGAGCGAAFMYWYLTGDLPWAEELLRWIANEAASYSDRLAE